MLTICEFIFPFLVSWLPYKFLAAPRLAPRRLFIRIARLNFHFHPLPHFLQAADDDLVVGR